MPLPPDLLQAVAAQGGGRISLILGAGCSFEAPTSIPLSRQCSLEMHQRLLADGVLHVGDCANPEDLSALADAVHARANAQHPLVERMRDSYSLHARPPNNGYLIAAALLCEGAVASVVTLNFDVALTSAITDLTCADVVGIVEGPQHLPQQKGRNIYYLHRNANAPDAETWVLRTVALQTDWQGHWEPVITANVLTRPVVVFAGLGTAVAVLLESTRLMRAAIPGASKLFQVDPGASADSGFFQGLNLPAANYIQLGWCDFMLQLSERLFTEHAARISNAASQKAADDGIQNEDLAGLVTQLNTHGLVKTGRIRAIWLLSDKKLYVPMEANTPPLMADLLLAIAMTARVSNAEASITEDGMAEFRRGATVVSTVVIASGAGHQRTATIEARTNTRLHQHRGRIGQPNAVLVAGTSEIRPPLTPPADVIRGDIPARDIVTGSAGLTYYHVDELRQNPAQIAQLVP